MSLVNYVIYRLSQAFITFLGASLLIFLFVRLLPGDPARLIAGPEALEEDIQMIRAQLGLDRPLYEQFATYMVSLLKGDLGTSIKYSTPVLDEILARLPYTLVLAFTAEALAVAAAVPLGILAALKPRSLVSQLVSVLAVVGASLPVFWTGLMLIFIFSVELKLLPSSGSGSPKHLILPSVTLAFFLIGNLARITRAAVMESLASNHVVTARAKGLSLGKILTRHVLRNSLIPILTVASVQLGALLGGAVVTETVFAWPGIGSLLIDSLFFRDYPLAQGVIMFTVGAFILINIVTDILYALVDPRVREVLWKTV